VGSASESVTVTAEAPLLRTENAEQSVTITGDRINSLPMTIGGGGSGPNGAVRNWLGFLTLAPGVSGTAYSAPVNGQPGGAFKILLEGQDVTSSNDTTWTSIMASASVESIRRLFLPDLELLAGIRPGGGRLVQLHHQERYQPPARQRL
jgi:hypothetical protein